MKPIIPAIVTLLSADKKKPNILCSKLRGAPSPLPPLICKETESQHFKEHLQTPVAACTSRSSKHLPCRRPWLCFGSQEKESLPACKSCGSWTSSSRPHELHLRSTCSLQGRFEEPGQLTHTPTSAQIPKASDTTVSQKP